jgi:hypothetical protein
MVYGRARAGRAVSIPGTRRGIAPDRGRGRPCPRFDVRVLRDHRYPADAPRGGVHSPFVCEGSVKTAMPSGRAHRRVQSVVQNAEDYPLRPTGWRLPSRSPDARCALRHVAGTPATGRLPSSAQRGSPLHPAMVRRQFNNCQTDGCQTMVDKGSILEARWPQSHDHSASSAAMALNSDRRRPGGRGRSRVTAIKIIRDGSGIRLIT